MPVGTVAEIKQVMNLPGENIRVLVEGESRGVIETDRQDDPLHGGRDPALPGQGGALGGRKGDTENLPGSV